MVACRSSGTRVRQFARNSSSCSESVFSIFVPFLRRICIRAPRLARDAATLTTAILGCCIIRGKQRAPGLFVDSRLKSVTLAYRAGTFHRGSRIYFLEPALNVRKAGERLCFALQDARGAVDPAPR